MVLRQDPYAHEVPPRDAGPAFPTFTLVGRTPGRWILGAKTVIMVAQQLKLD